MREAQVTTNILTVTIVTVTTLSVTILSVTNFSVTIHDRQNTKHTTTIVTCFHYLLNVKCSYIRTRTYMEPGCFLSEKGLHTLSCHNN